MNPLHIRAALGQALWLPPVQWGPTGWAYRRRDGSQSVVVSPVSPGTVPDQPWPMLHASIAGRAVMPTYDDLVLLHRAVWGDTGYAYEAYVPAEYHVNFHRHARHLWGREDGRPILPEMSVVQPILGRTV